MVEFVLSGTLIVYKCLFKLCHTASAPCIFDKRQGPAVVNLLQDGKHTARFKREWWTAL